MELSVEQKINIRRRSRGINSFLINPLNAQNKPKPRNIAMGI